MEVGTRFQNAPENDALLAAASSQCGTSSGNRGFWRAGGQPRRERSSSSEGERAGGNEENAGGRTSTDDLVGGLEPYHYP